MSRTGVFISYSRRDRRWLEMLRVHLKFLERKYDFQIWDDTRLVTGTEWRTEIRRAMDQARVAVLLVSAHYLSSDFIHKEELPRLLEAAEAEGALIFPLILTHCMFPYIDSLARFQAFNDPRKPVIDLSEGERDALFVKVTREVHKALLENQSIEPSPEEDAEATLKEVKKELRLSLARVSVVWILSRQIKGLTVSEIYELAQIKNRKYIMESLKELEKATLIGRQRLGNRTYWKITERGMAMAKEMTGARIFNRDAE